MSKMAVKDLEAFGACWWQSLCEGLAALLGMRGWCVHHFSGKEQGSRKLVSWQPDFITSAAHGALIISLGVCGTVNLHKALLRQQLDILSALENRHTPEVCVWWLQQLKPLANPRCYAGGWILPCAVSCRLDTMLV